MSTISTVAALLVFAGCGDDDNYGIAETPVEEPVLPANPTPDPEPTKPMPAPVPDASQVAAAAQQYLVPVNNGPVYTLASENLLRNGGFEDVTDDGTPEAWSDPGDPMRPTVIDRNTYSGTKALEVKLPPDGDFGMGQTITVKPGAMYRLTGYVKTDEVTEGVWLEVQDAQNGFENFAARTSEEPLLAQKWTRQSVDFTLPDDVEIISVLLRRPHLMEPPGEEGTVSFDNVSLNLIQAVEGENLISHGTFESGVNPLDGWAGAPQDVQVSPSGEVVVGESAVRIEIPEDMQFGIQCTVPVQPGKAYALTGMARTDDLAGRARLEVAYEAQRKEDSFLLFNEGLSGTNDWTDQVLTFTAPQNVTDIDVILRVIDEQQGGGMGTVWFDEIALYSITPP